MKTYKLQNQSTLSILGNMLLAAVALFINGLGVFLTFHAGLGAGPWDVFNLGLSKTFGILYGSASITVSIIILLIDIALREPIGIAMIIDAIVVGKSVDFFAYLEIIPVPKTLWGSILMIFIGMVIMGYTQFLYMKAALGCGPRDTLLVGLKKRTKKIPIGVVSIFLLGLATLIGYLLGGPVGIGTILCAFLCGPIMQFAFMSVRFDATKIKHQSIIESFRVIAKREIKKKSEDKNMDKKLGFGLMRLPSIEVDGTSKIDIELSKKLVDAFIERGYTYFDTAWMYCNFSSENAVKDILVDRYPRDKFTLTTKLHSGFIQTLEDRDKIFNAQREKTGVEFFDYYWLHDINTHSIKVFDKLDCFEWLKEKKASGLVKHIGFSFHDGPELLDKVLTEHPEFEYVQLQVNYLDWESNAIQSRKCCEVAEKHNIPVIVMEPVKGGTLADVPEEVEKIFKDYNPEASIPSWAIRFAASQKNVCMVLSGMNTMEQMLDNTSFMNDFKPINEEEMECIKKAVSIINSSIAIPCTGCEYCVSGCPKGIYIPKCFSLYNADKQEVSSKGWTPQGEYYDNLTATTGKASDCIECRQCEGVCPQHLPIVDYLKDVAEYFGK